jgi:hypothetical protein
MKAKVHNKTIAGALLAFYLGALALTPHARALEAKDFSGPAHGYPAYRDSSGKTLANGEFLQWLEDGRLHIKITYHFKDGRRIEETGILRQKPEVVQDEWSWRESKGKELLREFSVDFGSQTARAQKRENGELKTWEEKIDVESGRTFAGFAFSVALQNLRKQLLHGEKIELKAVGFSPKPRLVTVELSHAGVERMEMGGRSVEGDHFVIHPQIPAIAKLFVSAPDMQLWLTHPAPAEFLRWEGPVAEPDDQLVRVDLLPGEESGPAHAVRDESE